MARFAWWNRDPGDECDNDDCRKQNDAIWAINMLLKASKEERQSSHEKEKWEKNEDAEKR